MRVGRRSPGRPELAEPERRAEGLLGSDAGPVRLPYPRAAGSCLSFQEFSGPCPSVRANRASRAVKCRSVAPSSYGAESAIV